MLCVAVSGAVRPALAQTDNLAKTDVTVQTKSAAQASGAAQASAGASGFVDEAVRLHDGRKFAELTGLIRSRVAASAGKGDALAEVALVAHMVGLDGEAVKALDAIGSDAEAALSTDGLHQCAEASARLMRREAAKRAFLALALRHGSASPASGFIALSSALGNTEPDAFDAAFVGAFAAIAAARTHDDTNAGALALVTRFRTPTAMPLLVKALEACAAGSDKVAAAACLYAESLTTAGEESARLVHEAHALDPMHPTYAMLVVARMRAMPDAALLKSLASAAPYDKTGTLGLELSRALIALNAHDEAIALLASVRDTAAGARAEVLLARALTRSGDMTRLHAFLLELQEKARVNNSFAQHLDDVSAEVVDSAPNIDELAKWLETTMDAEAAGSMLVAIAARVHDRKGERADAARLWQAAAGMDPGESGWLQRAAKALGQNGQGTAALDYEDQLAIAEFFSTDDRGRRLRGIKAVRGEAALEETITREVAECEGDAVQLRRVAESLLRAGMAVRSVDVYLQARARDPESPRLRLESAAALLEAGQVGRAAVEIEGLLLAGYRGEAWAPGKAIALLHDARKREGKEGLAGAFVKGLVANARTPGRSRVKAAAEGYATAGKQGGIGGAKGGGGVRRLPTQTDPSGRRTEQFEVQ